jgi:hypothetical protein
LVTFNIALCNARNGLGAAKLDLLRGRVLNSDVDVVVSVLLAELASHHLKSCAKNDVEPTDMARLSMRAASAYPGKVDAGFPKRIRANA